MVIVIIVCGVSTCPFLYVAMCKSSHLLVIVLHIERKVPTYFLSYLCHLVRVTSHLKPLVSGSREIVTS